MQVIYDRMSGNSRGFGFVTMSTVEEAEKAVEMFSRYVSFIDCITLRRWHRFCGISVSVSLCRFLDLLAFSKFLDLDGFPVVFTFRSFPLLEQDLDGRFLTVNIAAPKGSRPERAPREVGHRIYVGNLPWSVDSGRLEEIFSEHGAVVSARVVSDRETGRSRGFGFVEMSTESEMNDAISSLDGEVNPFAPSQLI